MHNAKRRTFAPHPLTPLHRILGENGGGGGVGSPQTNCTAHMPNELKRKNNDVQMADQKVRPMLLQMIKTIESRINIEHCSTGVGQQCPGQQARGQIIRAHMYERTNHQLQATPPTDHTRHRDESNLIIPRMAHVPSFPSLPVSLSRTRFVKW